MEDRNRQRRVYRWEDRIETNWRLSKKETLNILSGLNVRIKLKDTHYRNWKWCSTVEAVDDELGTRYTLYIKKENRDIKTLLHEMTHILLDNNGEDHYHDETFVRLLINLFDTYGVGNKKQLLESAKKCNII